MGPGKWFVVPGNSSTDVDTRVPLWTMLAEQYRAQLGFDFRT